MRAGSIGRALNAAKLVFPSDALVPGVEGVEGGGAAVLESRRDRRVAVDGARESGGGLRLTDSAAGVGVDGGDRIVVGFGSLALGEAASVWVELVDGDPSDTRERGESGVDLVGETGTLGPPVNLLPVLLGETRGPLGEDGMSTLLRRE
jgi:hypothetical protein